MLKQNYIIDLHMHSNNSDGTCSTQEILDKLGHKGADIISFTDHDSVECYNDLKTGKARLYSDVLLIPGVELSCRYDGNLRDILGYGVSIPRVAEYLNEKHSLSKRIEKQRAIVEKLKTICHEQGLVFDSSVDASEGKKAEGFVVMYNELNRHPENITRFPFIANNTAFYWDYFSNRNTPFYEDEMFDLSYFEEAKVEIELS